MARNAKLGAPTVRKATEFTSRRYCNVHSEVNMFVPACHLFTQPASKDRSLAAGNIVEKVQHSGILCSKGGGVWPLRHTINIQKVRGVTVLGAFLNPLTSERTY